MNYLEIVAVAFGIVSVWLSTRQHIVSWPTALVNTALYFVIFARAGLYANMGLQAFFFGVSCYGWWAWLYGGAQHTPLRVSRTSRLQALQFPLIGVGATLILGFSLARFTDATLPWLDSGTTATSLIAQWMMARKLLESWLVWIVVDVVYIGMYFSQGLALTAGLYAAFLVLATMGYFAWRASYRAQSAAT